MENIDKETIIGQFIFDILDFLFEKYGKGKNIKGIHSFYACCNEIEIIKEAKGRDILYDYSGIPEGAFGRPGCKYSGEIDPNFDWDDFWNSIFDFTYEEFLEFYKLVLDGKIKESGELFYENMKNFI